MRAFVIAVITFIFLALAPVAFGAETIQPGGGNIDNQLQPGGGDTGSSGSNVTLLNPLGTSCNSTNTDCLRGFLISILDFVVKIGSIVVILMLVFVGYKFVTAQGNDSKIIEARGMLLWTVVGALILLGAKAIALGIEATVKALSVGG